MDETVRGSHLRGSSIARDGMIQLPERLVNAPKPDYGLGRVWLLLVDLVVELSRLADLAELQQHTRHQESQIEILRILGQERPKQLLRPWPTFLGTG